ncbi:hypothetical protein F0L74_26930 [Chitinophaga agrisoli]|uniref:Lipoprotein n=1 Tax=Chitinophaga agrisoli TaxID=2607653 RepID=A0A5B2VLT8_9BACT|nr:hypothetical protein [Chitinophaga agrisoli]KAA2239824.1 hypothetical protein F0L74_26930 [Chitinophaga agrisoli]
MKKLFVAAGVLLAFTCCQQQPSASSAADTTVTVNQQPASQPVHDTVAASAAAIPPEKLASAGKGIGKINLGSNADELDKLLGKPDFSDAAMGKAWLTWYSKRMDEHNNRNELNIYTTYADSTMRARVVKQIRVTSPFYLTTDSLQVYNDLARIQQVYPEISFEGKYKEKGGRTILLYDATSQGIAFEVAEAGEQRICTSMIVHEPGKKVTDIYITLHPELKK